MSRQLRRVLGIERLRVWRCRILLGDDLGWLFEYFPRHQDRLQTSNHCTLSIVIACSFGIETSNFRSLGLNFTCFCTRFDLSKFGLNDINLLASLLQLDF